jgi:hypothetical protein
MDGNTKTGSENITLGRTSELAVEEFVGEKSITRIAITFTPNQIYYHT